MKKIIGVIPARYKSSRFPGKPLVNILGIPMVIRVAEIVAKALRKENTYIATDDFRIKTVAESYGFNVVMTPESCLTGTDRLWEVAKQISADIYINIQGDEPTLNPTDINRIAQEKMKFPNHVINGMIEITHQEDPLNINIPKVLVNRNNELIYMSRLPIPGKKSKQKHLPKYKKQVCIYAFNFDELKSFGEMNSKAEYEDYEDIEILRFFDLSTPIKMVETSCLSLAVDLPKDVITVENFLKQQNAK